MVALTAVVFALATFQGGQSGPGFSRDALLTDRDAVFLLDPEVVTGPGVNRLVWSPDGTYLLVQRDRLHGKHPLLELAKGKMPQGRIEGETQFMIYAAPSQKTVPTLKLPIDTQIENVEWIAGSSKALVLAQVPDIGPSGERGAPKQTLFWISANGSVRTIAQAEEGEFLQIFASPYRPIVAVGRTSFNEKTPGKREQLLQFIDGEARPVGQVAFPESSNDVVWFPDGRVFAMTPKIVNRKVSWDWFRLSPANGTRELVANFNPPPDPKPVVSDLVVESGTLPASRPELPGVEAVFMANRAQVAAKAKSPDVVFVSTDAKLGSLSPAGTSVAYVHKGVAMVRPLARVPKQVYLDMKMAAERTLAVSNAKQAALALIMNAADNDDNMLASGNNWREQVMPYIKNGDILNAFTYTFAGGNLTSVEKPAETEIGYVTGPGGRAVAYADGHVKWMPDKP